MQMGEKIATQNIQDEMVECPFNEQVKIISKKEGEELEWDDLDSVQEAQANNGGTLGKNLNIASNGDPDTWEGAPHKPTDADPESANDSKRKDGKEQPKVWRTVRVPGAGNIREGNFPYTVAAHHLIPGNASLYTDENDLQKFMIADKTVKLSGKSWIIKSHIGYNVNGSHNGVWLPGNYAIRSKASPTGVTWGSMTEVEWQLNYVAACSKVTKGQFHDTHEKYSEKVLTLLNKIVESFGVHQCKCKLCQNRGDGEKITPPYFIKTRLYKLSAYLKVNLTLGPTRWRYPWFSSDRWRKVIFKGGSLKPSNEFTEAFNRSRREEI